jgi:hypothetical protein
VSSKLPAPADLPQENESAISIEQKAEGTAMSVWTLWRREKFSLVGNRIALHYPGFLQHV